jgi:hypothetical protein
VRLKWKLLAVLVALSVVLVVAAVLVWPRSSSATPENFYRITKGMTGAKVEEILGPPGDYTTEPTYYSDDYNDFVSFGTHETIMMWVIDARVMVVSFDESGRVSQLGMSGNGPLNRGTLYNLLWRAKRQWHRWFP